MDAVLEKLMHRADKELRRARRKHPQFVGDAGLGANSWGKSLAVLRKNKPECTYEDEVLWEEVVEFFADVEAGRSEAAEVEAAQVVAVLVRVLSEGVGR